MADTLKNKYAVDMHNWYNRRVTEAWDKAQERVSDVVVIDWLASTKRGNLCLLITTYSNVYIVHPLG